MPGRSVLLVCAAGAIVGLAVPMVSQGQSTTSPAERQPPASRQRDGNPTVDERVRRIVAEQLGVPPSRVVPAAKLVMDLGADSLDVVALTMALEEAFGIEIGDDDCENIVTVGDAIDAVDKRLKAAPRKERGATGSSEVIGIGLVDAGDVARFAAGGCLRLAFATGNDQVCPAYGRHGLRSCGAGSRSEMPSH